jgi:HSP20 family protein
MSSICLPASAASAGARSRVNVGGTPQSVEILAFAPGLDPASVEVKLDRGVLTIAGERPADLPSEEAARLPSTSTSASPAGSAA